MTDIQVEAVARAIFVAAGGYESRWERITENTRVSYRIQARAAIMSYLEGHIRSECRMS